LAGEWRGGDQGDIKKQDLTPKHIYETAINGILGQIRRLLSSPPEPEPPKKRIGFLLEEPKVPYITKMKRKS